MEASASTGAFVSIAPSFPKQKLKHQKKQKQQKNHPRLFLLLILEFACFGVPLCLLTSSVFLDKLYHGPLSSYIQSFRITHKGTDERGYFYSLDKDVTYYHRHCTKEDITTVNVPKQDRSNQIFIPKNVTSPEYVQDVMMTHGAVILPSVLSRDTATNLRTYLESRHDIQDQLGWQEKFWTGINRLSLGLGLNDDPSIAQAIEEIGNNQQIQTTLQGIFGVQDAAIVEISTLTCLHGAENQGLHTDSDYFGSSLLYARKFLHSYTMFVALQDTTSRMGATTVCPGTHWCANEDMEEFCLPNEYEYQEDTSDSAFADYNANEAFDVSSNGITSKQGGVLKQGDAMMFNQNAFHRGPQNDDPNFKDTNRAMFIVTFVNPRNFEQLGDVRQQGMGTYYYQRWTMWGHLFSDFKYALSRTRFWKQPWATLHAWGVLGNSNNQAVPWTEHVARQFANQMDFYEPGELPDFKEYLEHTVLGNLVKHLHKSTSKSNWHKYVPKVLKNAVALAKTIYVVGLFVGICFGWLLSPRGSKGRFVLRLTLWHVTIASLGYGIFFGLQHYSFLGRKIQTNEIHATGFPNTMLAPPPQTTLPDRIDFLVGTRYDADFLGSYNRALDYHPGNIHLNGMLQEFAGSQLPIACLAQLIWKHWQSSKINPPRMLLQDPATGYWSLSDAYDVTLQRMVVRKQNPLLNQLDTHLSQVLANARFGRRRDTVMARRFATKIVSDWQTVVFSNLKKESIVTREGVSPRITFTSLPKANLGSTLGKSLKRSPTRLLHDNSSIRDYLSPGSRVWAASVNGDSWQGRWESATILEKLENDFVRVVYSKNGVKQRMLPSTLVLPFHHLIQGDRVQVLHESKADSYSWLDGTIQSVSPLGFCNVELDYGSVLPRVIAADIRLPPPTRLSNVGDTVWASVPSSDNDTHSGFWKRATVVGKSIDWVAVKLSGGEPSVTSVSVFDIQPYFSIEEGDIAEVLLSDGVWWEAEVYDAYKSGDGEEFFAIYVAELNLYLEKLAAAYVRPVPPLLNTGTRVMANFGDDGSWFPGTIDHVYTEGRSYHVQYVDGDYEEYVSRDRIQIVWGDDEE